LVALALGAVLVAGASLSYADPNPNPKSQRELKNAIGEASAEEAAAIAAVQEVQARRAELDAAAAALDRQIADASAREAAAQAEVDAAQLEIDRIQAEINASKEDFEESAATLYRNAGSGSNSLEVLQFAQDPTDRISSKRYLTEVSRQAEREIDTFGALQDDLEDQRDAADAARAAVAAEKAEVERLRAEAEPARAAAHAEEEREAQMLAGISARRSEFEAQLASLQAEQQALGRGVSRGSGSGQLSWPCDGDVSSGFGYRVHPISGTRRMHTGLDLGCANGAPIHASGSGVVTDAGPRGGYGNAVVIDHGDGLATLYGHQSRVAVSAGQQVSEGEVIGYVGSTGQSTGPHLHWEVWVNGTPVDPMGYA
jgi:murein DD-endopeptidase MepM/ murein hydrolase activator NlpD